MRYPASILATCVVPWNERFEFMEDGFREEVRSTLQDLTRHVYIFGTAGEGYAVSDGQFERIVRVFWEETDRQDAHPMVGVISLSLSTVVERIECACDMGFRAFQISLPSWGVLTDQEVDLFFAETCGRFPECRFLHYNLVRAKRLLVGDDYARLSAAHPNLVAVKTGGASRDDLVDLLAKAPEVRFFLTELNYALMRDDYACGYLISLGVTNPARARQFFEAHGDELQRFGSELADMRDALMQCAGEGRMDGAYDKLLYKVRDPGFPLRLLLPYQGFDDAVYRRFLDTMPKAWKSGA